MKKYDVALAEIIVKNEIADGFFDITVKAPEMATIAKAGQFVHIKVPSHTLRRPISICEIDSENGTIRLVFQIRGKGTEKLAKIEKGEKIDILGPLGNGFPVFEREKKVLLVGGGIGVPPLLELAKHYGENAVAALGFRNSDSVILGDDFKAKGSNLILATDDGSIGYHGLITNAIENSGLENKYDTIYTCGPMPMIKSVAVLAQRLGAKCYVSLEERMACGVGACLGCACGLIDESGNTYNGHVCKDGPVFDYKKVAALKEIL